MTLAIDIADALHDALISGGVAGICVLFMGENVAVAVAGTCVVASCALLPMIWRSWRRCREVAASERRLSGIDPDWAHSLGLLKVHLEAAVVDWQMSAFGGVARGFSVLMEDDEEVLRRRRALAALDITPEERAQLLPDPVPFWQFEKAGHDPVVKRDLQSRLADLVRRTMSPALFRALRDEDRLPIDERVWTDVDDI